jgi:flagellar hook-length control protein FliK
LHEVLEVKKPQVFNTKMDVDAIKQNFRRLLQRKDRDHQIALANAQDFIDKAQAEKRAEEKDTEQQDILNTLKMRAATPRHTLTNDPKERDMPPQELLSRDKKRRAIILLQRLLRGRSEQNNMFEGKEKRLDLIAELRATEEWRAVSDTQEEHILIDNYQERIMDGVAEAMQSTIIASTLDSLSKELVRLKQERKIDAMVRLAENERRKREAEESGKRQAENVLRDR